MVVRMAGGRRRWGVLGLGMAAQAASCVFLYGLPYLLPELRRDLGLSLTSASTLVACPLAGVVLAPIAWGAAADRYGERLVITAGLVIAAAALAAAANAASALPMGILLAVAGSPGSTLPAGSPGSTLLAGSPGSTLPAGATLEI
ncbi:MAG: MFS transporter [Streptosporangiaceae bacterium]|nr:MFS transporter [Streptosporangiaceae bacterium]MBV9854607.1 MFS transporter [Streptosporangiaceae bacterium]